jgi:hypothetical protein
MLLVRKPETHQQQRGLNISRAVHEIPHKNNARTHARTHDRIVARFPSTMLKSKE